jgi:hypothetical protein
MLKLSRWLFLSTLVLLLITVTFFARLSSYREVTSPERTFTPPWHAQSSDPASSEKALTTTEALPTTEQPAPTVAQPKKPEKPKIVPVDVNYWRDEWIYTNHGKDKLYYWCKNITTNATLDRKVLFHAHWRFLTDDTRLPRHFSTLINSYIATQDLEHTKLILWSNRDLRNHPQLAEYWKYPFLETRVYVARREARGSPVARYRELVEKQDSRVYLDGDLFRLLVLYKHGGVYLDSDVMLLRDFTPLLNQEFLYLWGIEKMKTLMMNGAVMHSFQRSEWMRLLLTELPKMCSYEGFCWGYYLYQHTYYIHKPNVTIFPAIMFDPDWYADPKIGGNGPFVLFEKKRETSTYKLDDLYDGVFAYHWHNRWNAKVEQGSKRDRLEIMHDEIVKERLGRNTTLRDYNTL